MNKELETWQFAAERLKRNESVMLLVVAESSSSSPGRQGFKMIVAKDDLIGSVGGGVMEVELVESARKILSGGGNDTLIKTLVHRKNSPDSSGMICSGSQTVIFTRLAPEHYRCVRHIPRYCKKPRGRYLRVTRDGFSITRRFKNHIAFRFEKRGAKEYIYEESFSFKNKLFIVGGGHCALALSEIMSKMDFYITLCDDRPNLNTLEKNEFVHAKQIVESYGEIDEFIPSGANHFVVVMTLGYKTDEIVIRRLLDKNFKYFGVLGSRAKMATLLKKLKKEGLPEEKLNELHTPIGLPINSRTPEEIAVSIAAEIIQVKNKAV